jgi:hypothetical protein
MLVVWRLVHHGRTTRNSFGLPGFLFGADAAWPFFPMLDVLLGGKLSPQIHFDSISVDSLGDVKSVL